jgi:hypothetical protein
MRPRLHSSRARLIISVSVTHLFTHLLPLFTHLLPLFIHLQPPHQTHTSSSASFHPSTVLARTRDAIMSAPGVHNTGPFKFAKVPGLEQGGRGIVVANIYLTNGLLRVAVHALGLQKSDRLESLVSELQRAWHLAFSRTNRVQTRTNHATGELSNTATTDEIFIYGRNVTDTDKIDGNTMLRAVKNMAIRVVAETDRRFPGSIDYNRERRPHESVVIATLIEAIWALQEDIPSGFRSALLNTSLTRVLAYSRVYRQCGESSSEFQLREAQEKLAQSEKTRLRDEEKSNLEICKLKLQLMSGNPRHWENVPAIRLERGDNEDVDAFKVRTLLEEVGALEANNKIQAQEIDLLKMDFEESEKRHDWKDRMILGLNEKLENAAKEIQQLKQDTSELKLELGEMQGKFWDADVKVEDLGEVVESQSGQQD